jgi:3-deoxy-D-manno-octulosonate 8-phosphate phosphatase (KDO 8-P phosphatase)
MSKKRARKIKLLLMDVDGVMTDGTLWFFPAPAGARQQTKTKAQKFADAGGYAISHDTIMEAKGFNAHDGTGISLARLGGLKTGLITKRISDTVALRARDLRLDHIYQGIADKLTVFREILSKEKLSPEQAAYIGDDIIDLPIMRNCGLAIAVPNSRAEVLEVAHFVTEHPGGHGAVRDAVEFILKSQSKFQPVMKSYMEGRSPKKKDK